MLEHRYEGLYQASGLFRENTFRRFEQVKQIHTVLLVASTVLIAAYMWLLFRPWNSRMRSESRTIAGLLSQLPAEVDVEGHIKQVSVGGCRPRIHWLEWL